jgi:hypothetical protein
MRKQVARDEGRKTLDSDKRKAPGSSAQVRALRRKRQQTEHENIPQQEDT